MFWGNDGYERGYSRGGLDVVTAVNLFFKGILLFPIFLLAGYIGIIMMKHMIFQGIPSITAPTKEQQQQIHDRNHQIGITPAPVETKEVPDPFLVRSAIMVPDTPAEKRATEDSIWLSETNDTFRD